MLYKGGQKAVDEYTSSQLTGDEMKKHKAIIKACGGQGQSTTSGGNQASRKRQQRSGGGLPQTGGAACTTQAMGQPFQQCQGQGQGQGLKCGKCNWIGHKTADCYFTTGV